MTDAQKEAFSRAADILEEHFEGHVLAVHHTSDSPDYDGGEFSFSYGGGLTVAFGLAQRSKMRLKQILLDSEQTEEV